MSLSLLDLLIDENNIEIENSEIKFIKDVIIGSKRSCVPPPTSCCVG